MRGQAKQAYDGLDAMLQAVMDWQDKVDAFIATGTDDQDVIATHDSKGRLIELYVRPGLQQELTTEEFEGCVNEAIADNAARGYRAMKKMSDEFLAQFAEIPDELANHPVAGQLVESLEKARRGDRGRAG